MLKKCNGYRQVHREKHKDRYNEEQRKDMKKMKSIEKESRDREDYLKVKLFSVLFVISQ